MERYGSCQRGFTLIELLMTMGVIGILASCIYPSLFTARKKTDEIFAINRLREIRAAQETYRCEFCDEGEGHDKYGTLAQLETARLISWPTAATYKDHDYTFTDIGTPSAKTYGAYARADNGKPNLDFLITNDEMIRKQPGAEALPTTVEEAKDSTRYPVFRG